jgi:EmrB/QacA subfamily drug resistance transporter
MTSITEDRSPLVRWALASLCLSMLMPSLDTSIANAGLPTLATAFSASFHAVQWIVLAYLLGITTLIVSVGRLGDLVGRRRLLLVGISLFTIASLLCGMAPVLWLLIVARAAQGLGAAIMMALTVALVGETVPRERIGSAMGLLGTMSAIGTTLGPSLGGVLIAALGWRMIFLVNVPIGIANLILAQRFLPLDHLDRTGTEPSTFDAAGTALLALSLAAYALAMTLGRGHPGTLTVALLLAAMIGAIAFLQVERRVASPLIRLAMFRDPLLTASLTMSALVSTVMMATLVVGPFYLSRGLGLGITLVGVALSAGPLVSALTGVPAGRIVDRFGAQRLTLAGLAGIAAGALLVSIAPARLGIAGYLGPLVMMTSSYALFQAANNTALMTGISADRRGAVAGMLALSRNLGLITGASAMGALFALATRATDVTTATPGAVRTGMRTTFAVAALAMVAALGIARASQALAARARMRQCPLRAATARSRQAAS